MHDSAPAPELGGGHPLPAPVLQWGRGSCAASAGKEFRLRLPQSALLRGGGGPEWAAAPLQSAAAWKQAGCAGAAEMTSPPSSSRAGNWGGGLRILSLEVVVATFFTCLLQLILPCCAAVEGGRKKGTGITCFAKQRSRRLAKCILLSFRSLGPLTPETDYGTARTRG
nr:SNRPN upstream reading frame protein isoform X1 [Equus asinus]